jgi:uncharacterized membrane protein YjjP (DUF1212 family)
MTNNTTDQEQPTSVETGEPLPQPAARPPLTWQELTDVIDLAAWAGQLLMQNGADSERVEETVHRLGTALGCEWLDVFVSAHSLGITTISGDTFRTKIRRIGPGGVNMTIVSAVNRLSRRTDLGELDRAQVRAELERISHIPSHYPRWLVVVLVGLACAAFSRLLGGDWPVFGVTFVSAAVAMFVRQELARRHFNPLLVVTVTAFVASLLASSATVFQLSQEPNLALVASVLLLVPGVPLINSLEDLIGGYIMTGVARGVYGALISLAIALGLLLAMGLVGIKGL